MSLKTKGGAASRRDIDNVLDDLLGSDAEDTVIKQSNERKKNHSAENLGQSKKIIEQTGSAHERTSNADAKLSRKAVVKEPAESPYPQEDVAEEHKNIGNMDDLEADLFAGFTSNKPAPKSSQLMASQGKGRSSLDFDPDDPLGGLGLSDEEDERVKKNPAQQKRSKLNLHLTPEKTRVEPNRNDSGAQRQTGANAKNEAEMFITDHARKSTPSPRINSWDDPSVGTTASESEISPRQPTGKANKKSRLRHKASIEPSSFQLEGEGDVPEHDAGPKSSQTLQSKPPGKQKGIVKMSAEDDVFGDSDALPDDEEFVVRKGADSKSNLVPSSGKQASALDSLLIGGQKAEKKREPTLLEQMMSGKPVGRKSSAGLTTSPSVQIDTELGGYTPSSFGSRPTSAPQRRSVTFADSLGDAGDFASEKHSRPATAADKRKALSSSAAASSIDLGSSLDDSMSGSFKRASSAPSKNSADLDWLGLGDDLTDQFLGPDSSSPFSGQGRQKKESSSKVLEKNNDSVPNSVTPVKNSPASVVSMSEQPIDSSTVAVVADSPKKPARSRRPRFAEETVVDYKESPAKGNNIGQAVSSRALSPDLSLVLTSRDEKTNEDEFLSFFKKKKEQKASDDIDKSSLTDGASLTMKSESSLLGSSTHQAAAASHQQSLQLPDHQSHLLQQHAASSLESFVQANPSVLDTPPSAIYAGAGKPQRVVSGSPQVALDSLSEPVESIMGRRAQDNDVLLKAARDQFQRERSTFQSNINELNDKILKLEEMRLQANMQQAEEVRNLESKARRLEFEQEQLNSSIEQLRQRHKDELSALEASHANRLKFVEDSFGRRESQLNDEISQLRSRYEEKLALADQEKADAAASHKRKIEALEKVRAGELEKLKELHQKNFLEQYAEHEQQVQHLRMLKEQEVAAAVKAFSHTKSLQALMQQVQNSTHEVGELQRKIDASHHSQLDEREQALRAREEYVRGLEDRLQRQETETEQERQRLQSLLSKMEVQLREQGRQVEQDKWKISQDENRLKAMQAAFEDERLTMMTQFSHERGMINKARDDVLLEQKRIMAECYEERRRIAAERAELVVAQREIIDKGKQTRGSSLQAEVGLEAIMSSYQHETSKFNVLFAQLQQDKVQFQAEKDDLQTEKSKLAKEWEKLHAASKDVQSRSKEVEQFAAEAKAIYDEGIAALDEARVRQNEFADLEGKLSARSAAIQKKELALSEDRLAVEREFKELEADKRDNRCNQCKQLLDSAISRLESGVAPGSGSLGNTGRHASNIVMVPAHLPHAHATDPAQSHLPHNGLAPSNAMLTRAPSYSAFHSLPLQPYPLVHDPSSKIYPGLAWSANSPVRQSSNIAPAGLSTPLTPQNLPSPRAWNPLTTDQPGVGPPDLLMNSLEFKRSIRHWSTLKEKDDEFFEEEERYLSSLRKKHLTT